MNDIPEAFLWVALVIFVFCVLIFFALFVMLVRPWLRAALHAAPVSLTSILGMRLRGNPTMLLIDTYIALKRSGIPATISDVENAYIDARNRVSTSDDLAELMKKRSRDS